MSNYGTITKLFDARGNYKGYRDKVTGKRFGVHGEYKGRRDKDGKGFVGPASS